MAAAKVISLLAWLAAMLAGSHAAAEGCRQCGCRTVNKVTRLVKTMRDIEVPTYRCSTQDTFYPDKSAVCHTTYRCETFFKPHVDWHAQECRVLSEVCEHVLHCVDKSHCQCTCLNERHHKQHMDVHVTWARRECIQCETVAGCKTLYGTNNCGCEKSTLVKEPTGEICSRTAPIVRWVTYHVCDQCKHSWCDGSGEVLNPNADVLQSATR